MNKNAEKKMSMEADQLTAPQQPAHAAHQKIPPIIILYKESYKTLHTWLKRHCKASFTVKQTGGETLKLILNTTEDYVKVVCKLGEDGIPMYTTPAVRPPTLKTLIKGIPVSLTDAEVKEELEELGYIATLTERHRMPGTNQMTEHRVVILPDMPDHRSIFQLTRIYDLSIKVERLRRSRGHVQCFRCQGFNQRTTTAESARDRKKKRHRVDYAAGRILPTTTPALDTRKPVEDSVVCHQ
ncbi:uncharacterized protein LOC126285056 [Schistocerca gregaria]|uniref:uncharacterized protein LOC126285056 n=1 Tax=Schistocerca gregaria TaxID=7010 RepID=UPI00211E16C3|nr:uncharacterized protein LOC126285056 [Schistocerca gregaria]